MSYTLQAIIAPAVLHERIAEQGLPSIDLNAGGLAMIPLAHDGLEGADFPFLPLTDGGETTIGDKLHNLCCILSEDAKVAYVEAEFFGGEGIQACLLFEGGKETEPATIDEEAINHALRWLGVRRNADNDEFNLVGLGRRRNTADWLE